MTFILQKRIVCGYSRLGKPPVAWFEIDPLQLASLIRESRDFNAKVAALGIETADHEMADQQPPLEVFAGLVSHLLRSVGHRPGPAKIVHGSGVASVALPVDEGQTALNAGELMASLLSGDNPQAADEFIERLAEFRLKAVRRALSADARLVEKAAREAGLPTLWLDQEPFEPFAPGPNSQPLRFGLLQIGYGAYRRIVAGSLPDGQDDALLESLRCRAELMPRLAKAGLPIPAQDFEFSNRNTASRAIRSAERIGYPVVVKSLFKPRFPYLYEETNVSGPLKHAEEVRGAFELLAGTAHRVWVEGWAPGDPYCFLVLGGQVQAISQSKQRSDFREQVAEDIVALAERAAAACNLPILAGVDMQIVDPEGRAEATNCVVTNVLPDPDIARHARDLNDTKVAARLVSTLFAKPESARIPIAAVTGTNGKTTTCRMLQRILTTEYRSVALATTDGAFIGQEKVHEGDVAGATGAAWVLADDRAEAAVLETARGGLLKVGTAFDTCDVATCLNVRADHIGYDGIDSLEAMAEVKGRLIERALKAVVLNADDSRCLAMRSRASCDRIVLVAESASQSDVRAHRQIGGEAVFVERRLDEDWLVLARGDEENLLMTLAEVKATMGGLLESNCFNARFAAATAWALGIEPVSIRRALATFSNSVDDNPGRHNFIEGFPFKVLCDYAQNPDGVGRLMRIVDRLEVSGRMHLVCMTIGARHRDHIDEVAGEFSRRFSTISISGNILNIEPNPEWAGEQPRRKMLDYFQASLIQAGSAVTAISSFDDEVEAIRSGLGQAVDGDLVVVLAPPEVALPVLIGDAKEQSQDSIND